MIFSRQFLQMAKRYGQSVRCLGCCDGVGRRKRRLTLQESFKMRLLSSRSGGACSLDSFCKSRQYLLAVVPKNNFKRLKCEKNIHMFMAVFVMPA